MSRDTSFYYSFLVLPPRKRRAIIAVWDFCRAIDDAVDEAGPPIGESAGDGAPSVDADGALTPEAHQRASEQLASWRTELAACYAIPPSPDTAQGRALEPFIREFGLPRQQFSDLIDGVEMDLAHMRYPTVEALLDYCRHVASTVGLICLEIFGYRNPAARDYAVNLGLALQVTNIIRDVASDLARGRIYLPLEDLERFSVTEDALRAGRMTPQIRALLEFQCQRARAYFARAASQLPREDASSLLAAEIMGGIYFGILERIERAGYDVFTQRIRVPRPERAVIALRIWLRTALGIRARRASAGR